MAKRKDPANPTGDFPLHGRTLAVVRDEGRPESTKGVKRRRPVTEPHPLLTETAPALILEIPASVGGAEDWRMARSLSHLAALFHNERKYAQAESLYHEALKIQERVLGSNHQAVATNLNNLARLYQDQGKYTQAEALHKRSLEIVEREFGEMHPKVARRIANLADVYFMQRKYAAAEPLYWRLVAIAKNSSGPVRQQIDRKLKKLSAALHLPPPV
jgi:tetratricopeptide (TPR) repeat protein